MKLLDLHTCMFTKHLESFLILESISSCNDLSPNITGTKGWSFAIHYSYV